MNLGAPDLQSDPATHDAVDFPALRGFIASGLRELARRAQSAPRALACFTVPVPAVALDTAGDALRDALTATRRTTGVYSVLWNPPSGASYVGVGRAVDIVGTGSERIAAVAARAESIWPRIAHRAVPGCQPVEPRFFGGFAFVEGAAAAPPWQAFGDARFVLPTWLYERDGERARLCLTVAMDGLPGHDEISAIRASADRMTELERILAYLARAATGGRRSDERREQATVVAVSDTEPDDWRRQIEDIRTEIAARRCDKIVAARCRVLELERPIDPAQVLRALHRAYPDCFRFAYRFGDAGAFVGATPERLITRDGDRIATQALAGSIAAGNGDAKRAAAALLASSKDRSEQDFVVQTIRAVLEPLCSELRVPETPEIRELRHVLHLETPISATLARPVHVLQLVSALHPTPAVGGVPTALATEWIAAHEPMARGWYAAPVGWFDARGQGEFAVAIRSGLLHERSAFIYAGAGIVRDSDPDAEFAETALKQRPLTSALGVVG